MKIARFVISLMIFCIMITACDTFGMIEYYPYYKAERWYCKEIDFELVFPRDENGRLLPYPLTPLEWNGEIYDVNVGIMASYISFTSDEDGDDIWREILSGSWEYRNNNLVVYSFEGSIFGDAYSELVFVPDSET